MAKVIVKEVSGIKYFYDEREERTYDLGWLIPDYDLIREFNGKTYTHISRVEWNEIQFGHPIYKKGTTELLPGLPMTYKFEGQKVQLTNKDADLMWYDVFKSGASSSTAESLIRDRFLRLKKNGVAFTDFPVDGIFYYNPVVTTNNVIYLLGDRKNIGGVPHLSFRTMKNGSLSSMRDQLKKWPLLKMRATISTRNYGSRGVDPFDHLDGRDVFFLPFNTSEVGWVAESRVRILSRIEPIPNSYYPER